MDPNMINQFMKNPEMMKMAMDMLQKNPGLMENMKDMLKNKTKSPQEELVLSKEELDLEETPYELNQTVTIQNLKTEIYNQQKASIKGFCKDKNRFKVWIIDLEKFIYLKPENIFNQPSPHDKEI